MRRTKSAATAVDVRVKTVDFKVKAAGGDDDLAEGEFIAYASAFGNVDSYGDIVDPGAFERTLKEWADTGDTIPVLWGHDVYDPFNNIGGLKTAEEVTEGDKQGLKVHGQLDLDNPTAAQVYRLMKGRRTTKMSFAYAVRDEKKEDDGNHLKDVDLFEVSVVQIPANDQAEIVTVKHALAPLLKSGRVLSAKNEATLREARDAIDSVLKALGDEEDQEDEEKGAPAPGQEEQASGSGEGNPSVSDEDPSGGKSGASGTPKSAPSVDDDLDALQFELMAAAVARKE